MPYDAKLHAVLACGPQHAPAEGTDGWCEHWRVVGLAAPNGSMSTVKGEREGDRDCMPTPAVYVFEKIVNGKVVNGFRSCAAHRSFITTVETGWTERGYHPYFLAAHTSEETA